MQSRDMTRHLVASTNLVDGRKLASNSLSIVLYSGQHKYHGHPDYIIMDALFTIVSLVRTPTSFGSP